MAGGDRGETITVVADHYARRLVSFALDHVPAIDGHRTAVPIILERGRRRTNTAAVVVVQDVPSGNAPQQPHAVGALRIVRKPGPAFIG